MPLAEAKALVDPAAFTREMTGILLEKQSHPLVAQMMKPAGSGDPPPAKTSQWHRQPRTPPRQSARAVPVGSCGQRGVPTVATHDREPLFRHVLIGAVTMGYPWLTTA